jgi:hypothetical protein
MRRLLPSAATSDFATRLAIASMISGSPMSSEDATARLASRVKGPTNTESRRNIALSVVGNRS